LVVLGYSWVEEGTGGSMFEGDMVEALSILVEDMGEGLMGC
jgi:hypothetical protein